MLKYIKIFDFFPNPSSFTIDQNNNFKTATGGCLTFLSILICFSFTFEEVSDYHNKKNPASKIEFIYPEEDKIHKFHIEDLIVSWRLEDKESNPLSDNQIKNLPFYPKAKFYKYKINDGKFNQNDYITLNSTTRCSDYFKENGINLTLKGKEDWNCIDTSNITMGGDWNKEFLHYFDLSLNSCEEIKENVFENCFDFKKIKEFFTQEIYISFNFAKVFNDDENLENPLKFEFKNYYKRLDMNLNYYEKCQYNFFIVKDEIGEIQKEYKETKKLGFKDCVPSFSFNDFTDYKERKKNIIFYNSEFYLDKHIEQHLRIYKKLFDVFAKLGGFFNITFIIVSLVYAPINLFGKNYYLLNYFFKYEDEEDAKETQKKYLEFKNINKRNTKNKSNKSKKQNNNQIKKESHSGFNNVSKIRNIYLTIINQIDEENEANEKNIYIEKNLEIIRKDNQDKDDIIKEDLSINNLENQVNNDFNHKNSPIENKNEKNSNNNYLSNRFLKDNADNQEKLDEKDIDENIPKYNFNFKEFIEKTKNSFQRTSLIPYYFSCCRNKSNKNLYISLENGIFQINKKLELIRYLKNLQLLRIVGKVTLKDQERFYVKNYYKDVLDVERVTILKGNKKERIKFKENQMFEFIKEKSNEDFILMEKKHEMIFNNIFNQDD